METLGDIATSKNEENEEGVFYCNICDYKCCKKFNLYRHFTTSKHIKLTSGDIFTSQKDQKEQKYICQHCNKEYNSRNGLWKHNKICNKKINNEDNVNTEITNKNSFIDKDDLILELLKQNK